MAHKSNPYKKARAAMRWKWKKKPFQVNSLLSFLGRPLLLERLLDCKCLKVDITIVDDNSIRLVQGCRRYL
ncbi:hypothetical protein FOZ61_007023 [Perkinsus olseni]|uniref:Uncharacterized protein n=1 Tax=Perkinsus olseni TaxID=32597 RepID=A0A7J6LBJ8_PEROL|nr:hypothetical protein FOZ61_007023 [Perkinsus olseni]